MSSPVSANLQALQQLLCVSLNTDIEQARTSWWNNLVQFVKFLLTINFFFNWYGQQKNFNLVNDVNLKYADYLSGFLRTHLRFPETDLQRRQNYVHVHVLYCVKRNAYLRTREKCRSYNSEASAFYRHFCYVLNCLEMFYIMTIN